MKIFSTFFRLSLYHFCIVNGRRNDEGNTKIVGRILYWFVCCVNVDVYVGCPVWKKFNISKYITSSSRRRSAIQNSIIWYAAKSGEKAAMGWKCFLGWAPRWGSIEGGVEGAAVTDGMSRTDVGIIHYDWPTGFLYASSSSNKRRSYFF